MNILEDHSKDLILDRIYPSSSQINKLNLLTNRVPSKSNSSRDKKRKIHNDTEFNDIVSGLYDLLNEVNKYSKNKARKTKRTAKTAKFEDYLNNSFEKITKKTKICNENSENIEEYNSNNLYNQEKNKEFGHYMKPNFESSLSEENKRDRKNGLYRFKDDIEGDKDLKNLNMLYKKDDKNDNQNMNKLFGNFPGGNENIFPFKSSNQGSLMSSLAEILKNMSGIQNNANLGENNSSNQNYNIFNFLTEMLDKKIDPANILATINLENQNNGDLSTTYYNKNFFPFPKNNFNNNINSYDKGYNTNGIGKLNFESNDNKVIIDDYKYLNLKNINTPFKRAGTHVAIAYYIYVTKNKNKSKTTNECDPTLNARLLREKKNLDTSLEKMSIPKEEIKEVEITDPDIIKTTHQPNHQSENYEGKELETVSIKEITKNDEIEITNKNDGEQKQIEEEIRKEIIEKIIEEIIPEKYIEINHTCIDIDKEPILVNEKIEINEEANNNIIIEEKEEILNIIPDIIPEKDDEKENIDNSLLNQDKDEGRVQLEEKSESFIKDENDEDKLLSKKELRIKKGKKLAQYILENLPLHNEAPDFDSLKFKIHLKNESLYDNQFNSK